MNKGSEVPAAAIKISRGRDFDPKNPPDLEEFLGITNPQLWRSDC
jgi:hypothetical protein